MEGFESGGLSFASNPDANTTHYTISANQGRSARTLLMNYTAGGSVTSALDINIPPFTAGPLYFRIAVRSHLAGAVAHEIFRITDGTNSIRVINDHQSSYHRYEIYGSSSTSISDAITFTGTPFIWQLLEISYNTITGVFTVRVDGVVIGSSFASKVFSPNKIRFGVLSWRSTTFFDDLAINDSSGSTQNSWCGDGIIHAIIPNGAGSSTQFTPNTGANWAAVDDVPYDGDTTYVWSSTSGHKDLYNMTTISIPAGSRIVAVQPVAVAKRMDSGSSDSLQVGIKAGATEDFSSSIVAPTFYGNLYGKIYEKNPDTNADWTQANLDGVEGGIRIP